MSYLSNKYFVALIVALASLLASNMAKASDDWSCLSKNLPFESTIQSSCRGCLGLDPAICNFDQFVDKLATNTTNYAVKKGCFRPIDSPSEQATAKVIESNAAAKVRLKAQIAEICQSVKSDWCSNPTNASDPRCNAALANSDCVEPTLQALRKTCMGDNDPTSIQGAVSPSRKRDLNRLSIASDQCEGKAREQAQIFCIECRDLSAAKLAAWVKKRKGQDVPASDIANVLFRQYMPELPNYCQK